MDTNDGELEAQDWYTQFKARLPAVLQESTSTAGIGAGYDAGTATRRSDFAPGGKDYQTPPSFFEKLQGGVQQAWDKDPLEVLKAGFGAVGGAYTAEENRKAAALRAQSYLDQQNNADALHQGEVSRYNASFNNAKRTAAAKKPLSRLNGTPIYGNTGTIKG
jgi:hypothetical protein